jgi:superfamily I DNA/RNA helicase
MTTVQQSVLDQFEPVAITGGPGTGKSVVSLWRHIRNHDTKIRRSLILTYTKTLEYYLSSSAADENIDAGRAVGRTLDWLNGLPEMQDEIIIDEAQDVDSSNYPLLKTFSDMISYGADDQQILYPGNSTTQDELRILFPDNHPYELDENFRNSFEILHFVKSLLPNRMIPENILQGLKASRSSGVLPKCMLTSGDDAKQEKAILDIIQEFRSESHNIGILLPLQRNVDNYYNFLLDNNISCSKYFHDGDDIGEIDNVHVTTFKSSKGIEFDTVILPNFQSWKFYIEKLDVVEENDYYVAFTRARRNLYLICKWDLRDISTLVCEKIKL